MCQRIYTHFNICGCQLFTTLIECKHGPGSPLCGPIHSVAIAEKKWQECRYHARVSYLRQGATSPPTTPLSQDTQATTPPSLSQDRQSTPDRIVPGGYHGYWEKGHTTRKRLQNAFLAAIEEAEFDTSDEFLEAGWDKDRETVDEDVDMGSASDGNDGSGHTEVRSASLMDVDENC